MSGRQPDQSPGGLFERLRGSIGQEVVFQAPDAIGAPAFRQYALAIGDFNPLYSDLDFARAHGLPTVMAPPTLICDTWQYVDSDIDGRGYLVGGGPSGELDGLRAGNDYEFFQPVHPDDIITAHLTVKDVVQRETRSGPVIFQVIEAAYRNQRGELLATNAETLFYREQE